MQILRETGQLELAENESVWTFNIERLVEAVSMDWTTNLKRLEEMADRFPVMSDLTRLRILAVLGEQELSVQDICDRTGFKQSNVSKHLQVLREIGAIALCKFIDYQTLLPCGNIIMYNHVSQN